MLQKALDSLQSEGDPRALDKVFETLDETESVPIDPLLRFATAPRGDPEQRARALELLAEHGGGDPRVSSLLKTLAANDRSEDVRMAARALLERAGAR